MEVFGFIAAAIILTATGIILGSLICLWRQSKCKSFKKESDISSLRKRACLAAEWFWAATVLSIALVAAFWVVITENDDYFSKTAIFIVYLFLGAIIGGLQALPFLGALSTLPDIPPKYNLQIYLLSGMVGILSLATPVTTGFFFSLSADFSPLVVVMIASIAPFMLTKILFKFLFHQQYLIALADHPVCLSCGYDIRASKDRCPECATPIAQSSAYNKHEH
jgi:hypothetical protein